MSVAHQTSTPAPTRSRIGMPTPSRVASTGIPTPGSRPRSSAGGQLHPSAALNGGFDEMRALSDAIRANDPASHRSNPSSAGMASPAISDSGFNFSTAGGTVVPRKSASSRPSVIRPSSRASTSADPFTKSMIGSTRSKTPTSLPSAKFAPRGSIASTVSSRTSLHGRSESRQSDFSSAGRPGFSPAEEDRMARKEWRVGDQVRCDITGGLEGAEGIVQYIGRVGDKPAIYVGIELLPSFHGQGKNDGSVNGTRYFSCAQGCGVFVASDKVSPSMNNHTRAASVASSRGSAAIVSGRATPAGRKSTTGKGTVRLQPVTPSRKKAISVSSGSVTPGASFAATPGSRAAKYEGLTAKQLSTAKAGGLGSPAVTPKPVNGASFMTPGRNRVGLQGTPKGRISGPFSGSHPPPLPSMPPPDSPTRRSAMMLPPQSPRRSLMDKPVTPTLSQTSTDTYVDGEGQSLEASTSVGTKLDFHSITANGRALQDQIARLAEGKKSPLGPGVNGMMSPTRSVSAMSPSPSNSLLHLQQLQTDRLKGQVESLEQENAILRSTLETMGPSDGDDSTTAAELVSVRQRCQSLQHEHESMTSQLSLLREQHAATGRTLEERDATIDTLTSSTVGLKAEVAALQSTKEENEIKLRELASVVAEKTELVESLKEAAEAKATSDGQTDAALKAKDVEIGLLEDRVQKALAELEEERRELGGQVDQLRRAGQVRLSQCFDVGALLIAESFELNQETIALYEERLAHHEAHRYEMDEVVQELEAKLQIYTERPSSPSTVARQTNAATRIENESLKEQLSHLQQKVSQYEDQLDDMRATTEQDEEAINTRIIRYRETEANLRKELGEVRKDAEKVAKAEDAARLKVAEVEEAFRENDLALENARADIESLRAELANLEGVRQANESGVADQLADAAKKASSEQTRLVEEAASLREALEQAQGEARDALEEAHAAANRLVVVTKTADELRARTQTLEADRNELEKSLQDEATKLQTERNRSAELQLALDNAEPHRGSSIDVNKDLAPHDSRRDSGMSKSSRRRSAEPDTEDDLKNQVTGLKILNVELSKERSALVSQVKMLESELKMHQTEVQELRENITALENTMQETLEREETALDGGDVKACSSSTADTDSPDPAATIKGLKVEIETLQKRLTDVEKEHSKTVHALNKDILDLENLVEAKIYREDDLEREIERLNEKIARRRSSRKNSGGDVLALGHRSSPSRASIASVESLGKAVEPVCEVCGEPGHDLVQCETLGFGSNQALAPSSATSNLTVAPPTETPSAGVSDNGELDHWCDNCEVLGDHVTNDCPHSDEVF
ncbi:hypothetical protein FRB97_009736 [Tulasnella sp. 331]|nr:hypothetical protein FRB97_009736 [Tulasnella sp. 331]KAG8887395.1 hypothetical protein FRB98_009659 [Tulasnella sp. 332]